MDTKGLIREEGGKMYMSEGLWIDAYNELYEAFRNYQASDRRRRVGVVEITDQMTRVRVGKTMRCMGGWVGVCVSVSLCECLSL